MVGAFAINNSLFDVGVMLVMGIIGFFMEKHDIPVAPAVLGIVLGPIVEENFMVS
jgi:TctA family transporter